MKLFRIFFAGTLIFAVSVFLLCGYAQAQESVAYRTEGSVDGTGLYYEGLAIIKGKGVLCIINPGRQDTHFKATFSFFNAKGQYITGFQLEGKAVINIKNRFYFNVSNWKKLKHAKKLVVIGKEL